MKIEIDGYEYEVTMIEVPPHSRTVKIYDDEEDVEFVREYIQIPYTQFYFVEKGKIQMFISNTKLSIKQEEPKISIFAANTMHGWDICWGKIKIKRPYDYNKIISDFWLSTFIFICSFDEHDKSQITIKW